MADAEKVTTDDRGERTRVMLADRDFMDKFCAHIANGGSGPSWCQERDVRFSDVMAWVFRDDVRKSMYAAAETARAQWFVQSILMELKNIGLVDIREAYTDGNCLKDVKQIPAPVARCIVAVETEELYEGVGNDREMIGYTKRVKFSDKLRALELLGKNLQMFIDTSRVIHTGRVTLEDLVSATVAGPAGGGPALITQEVTGELENSKETPKSLEVAGESGPGTVREISENSAGVAKNPVRNPDPI